MMGLGGGIGRQKREPVATLGWLLGLAARPVVGLLVYQVFGPQKIRRHRLRRSRSRMPREQFDARGGDEAAELARLGAAETGLPPSTAPSVPVLVDGAAKHAALLAAIAPARAHIPARYCTFHTNLTGQRMPEALGNRAPPGCGVRSGVEAAG